MSFWARVKLERRRIKWSSLSKTTKMFFIAIIFIFILSVIVTLFSLAATAFLGVL